MFYDVWTISCTFKATVHDVSAPDTTVLQVVSQWLTLSTVHPHRLFHTVRRWHVEVCSAGAEPAV